MGQQGMRSSDKDKTVKGGRRRRRLFPAVVIFALVATSMILLSKKDFYTPVEPEPSQSAGSLSFVDSSPSVIPEYSGEGAVVLNGNMPNFTGYDLSHITGENYSELDALGRCGTAVAMLDRSMMPDGNREWIGEIIPTGWKQKKYPEIVDSDPPYLYNRSHLIAYALTGQNANERNLITGTRYMNAVTMLSYEEQVMKYLDDSANHVLYRISPYFSGNELLPRGVEMEAYSVEDKGRGVCYHVFVYNVQPGIEIDYMTGDSREESH